MAIVNLTTLVQMDIHQSAKESYLLVLGCILNARKRNGTPLKRSTEMYERTDGYDTRRRLYSLTAFDCWEHHIGETYLGAFLARYGGPYNPYGDVGRAKWYIVREAARIRHQLHIRWHQAQPGVAKVVWAVIGSAATVLAQHWLF